MASFSVLDEIGLPVVRSASNSACNPPIDITGLLKLGPVIENADRAASHRSSGGARGERARLARETLDILEAGAYTGSTGSWTDISLSIQRAVESSAYLATAKWRPCIPSFRPFTLSMDVACCSVLSAAQKLATSAEGVGKVGVLNFASARNPGGGFSTGAEAQEECIARSSALYPCLTKHFDNFFVPSRRCPSGAYTHDVIYSPQVPVIRDMRGGLLADPYLVDFATAAAPNLGVMIQNGGKVKQAEQEAEQALRERAMRVLASFAEHGAVDLVLGAWGCGVFKNDPTTVARIFKTLLVSHFKGCFRHVVFAVLDPKMAEVFATVFGSSSSALRHGGTVADTDPNGAVSENIAAAKPSGSDRKSRRWKKGDRKNA